MYQRHGESRTRLYQTWRNMKCRCYVRSYPAYSQYGARGIIVCDEWVNDYIAFRKWAMSHGYAENLELDRIDVNGNYTPDNCQWITHHEQTLNRRDTLYIEFDGRCEKLQPFCKKHGINIGSMRDWKRRGILEQKLASILGTSIELIQQIPHSIRDREVIERENPA